MNSTPTPRRVRVKVASTEKVSNQHGDIVCVSTTSRTTCMWLVRPDIHTERPLKIIVGRKMQHMDGYTWLCCPRLNDTKRRGGLILLARGGIHTCHRCRGRGMQTEGRRNCIDSRRQTKPTPSSTVDVGPGPPARGLVVWRRRHGPVPRAVNINIASSGKKGTS